MNLPLRARKCSSGHVLRHNSILNVSTNTLPVEGLVFLARESLATARGEIHEIGGLGQHRIARCSLIQLGAIWQGNDVITAEKSDPLIEKLIRRLSDPNAIERRNAAGALRLHGQRAASAVPELIRLLNDADGTVRAEARRALERLNQWAA